MHHMEACNVHVKLHELFLVLYMASTPADRNKLSCDVDRKGELWEMSHVHWQRTKIHNKMPLCSLVSKTVRHKKCQHTIPITGQRTLQIILKQCSSMGEHLYSPQKDSSELCQLCFWHRALQPWRWGHVHLRNRNQDPFLTLPVLPSCKAGSE